MFLGKLLREFFNDATDFPVVGQRQLVQIGLQYRLHDGPLARGIGVKPVLGIHIVANLFVEIPAQVA